MSFLHLKAFCLKFTKSHYMAAHKMLMKSTSGLLWHWTYLSTWLTPLQPDLATNTLFGSIFYSTGFSVVNYKIKNWAKISILTFRIEVGEKLLLSSFRSIFAPDDSTKFSIKLSFYFRFRSNLTFFRSNFSSRYERFWHDSFFHFKSQKQLNNHFFLLLLWSSQWELCHLLFFVKINNLKIPESNEIRLPTTLWRTKILIPKLFLNLI